MFQLNKYRDLGNNKFSWLDAHYHFNFSTYFDPQKTGIGSLIVINDDLIEPHTGFDFHPHKNMEIITYVRKGAISHQDNQGNKGKTSAGDIQIMSAGKGIIHAEHNLEDEVTNLYQIWIKPNKLNIEPRWETFAFPKNSNQLKLLVTGIAEKKAKDIAFIYGNAEIYGGNFSKQTKINHQSIAGAGYVLVSAGIIQIAGITAHKGDGIMFSAENQLDFTLAADSEILLIVVFE